MLQQRFIRSDMSVKGRERLILIRKIREIFEIMSLR